MFTGKPCLECGSHLDYIVAVGMAVAGPAKCGGGRYGSWVGAVGLCGGREGAGGSGTWGIWPGLDRGHTYSIACGAT